jgi:predicted RNA-binding Zn-ribbon protein involved in translation (DUF1610 family)
MKMQLIYRNGEFPPNGFEFIDPRTGFKIGGTDSNFDETVRKIIQHRLANPKIYPPTDARCLTADFVSDELDTYTCNRLGNSPSYCKDMDERKVFIPPFTIQKPANACPKCGETDAKPRFCQTCAGSRILGFICSKCGFERPPR